MRDRTRLLGLLLGIVFLLAGISTAAGLAPWPELFVRWGYPPGARVVAGLGEAAGGALLLLPRLAPAGALLLAPLMLAAVYTHVTRGVLPMAVVPLTLLVLLVEVYRRARRGRTRARTTGR